MRLSDQIICLRQFRTLKLALHSFANLRELRGSSLNPTHTLFQKAVQP
jgi:hypothetical protein